MKDVYRCAVAHRVPLHYSGYIIYAVGCTQVPPFLCPFKSVSKVAHHYSFFFFSTSKHFQTLPIEITTPESSVMDWDKHLWESYGNPMYVRPHPPGETWAQSIYDPEHVEIHRWPSHKFDMKEWEAVEGLWHKYNTITVPLLDYNAFMLDLREISAKTSTREELEAQLQERREQRADELKRCFKNMRAYVGIILEDYEEALNSGLGPGSLDHNCDWWVSMRSILREGSMASIAKFLGDIYRSVPPFDFCHRLLDYNFGRKI